MSDVYFIHLLDLWIPPGLVSEPKIHPSPIVLPASVITNGTSLLGLWIAYTSEGFRSHVNTYLHQS